MTNQHPAHPTKPMVPGAPLPKSSILPTLTREDIIEELTRAEVELLHALARHRKSWKSMRERAEERDLLVSTPGGLAAIDSDPVWKKRTGDVAWWRDEVTCQATAVIALRGMLNP